MTSQATKINTVNPQHRAHQGVHLPPWLPWFLMRILSGIAVVMVISLIVFMATQALPSDPARVILGPEAPEASVQILREQLGLTQPILVQYEHWLFQVIQGDFGRSIDSHVLVTDILKNCFTNTLALSALVIMLSVPLSIVLGISLALRRDRMVDRLVVSIAIVFKAVPGFVLAIGLMMLFSTSVFHILPAASLLIPGRSPFTQLEFLVLPVVALTLSLVPYLMRLVRGSMIDALESDYVTAARLRGIPEARIIWTHVLPNALVPVVQGTALSIRVLLSGAIIIEVIFSYPGIGNALNAAIELRDIPTIQAIVLLLTTCIVVVNLLADLLTTLLTPKIRTAKPYKARSPGLRQAIRLWKSGRPITVKPVDRCDVLTYAQPDQSLKHADLIQKTEPMKQVKPLNQVKPLKQGEH